ncbi:MAG: trypsin-like serine protease [Oligoflexia bacterium]|nr:trypsin-like serine protease [Oligoflexia bacterium]
MGGAPTEPGDGISRSVFGLFNSVSMELCTATLVSSNAALTAAHCVVDNDISKSVAIFSDDLLPFILNPGSSVAPTARVIEPDVSTFDGERAIDQDDIAIIHLDHVPPGYSPVQFAPGPINVGDEIVIAGFGASAVSIDPKTGAIHHTDIGQLKTAEVIVEGMDAKEIFIDQSHGVGACNGDSGGPAFVKSSTGELQIWGVISRGVGNSCGETGKITNALQYMDWISRSL